MNHTQRELFTKTLADAAKGIFIGALLAGATDNLTLVEAYFGVLFAIFFYLSAHVIAGGSDHD